MINPSEKASEIVTQDAQENLTEEVSVSATTDAEESAPAETSDAPSEAAQPSQSAARTAAQTTGAVMVSLPHVNARPMSDYLRKHLSDDLKKYRRVSNLDSGFANVSKLHAGLYVLGAVPSAGKTTFTYQMAEQIAATGVPVIFFSLEQSQLELTTKSLSRRIYLRAMSDPSYRLYTATEIRDGAADQSKEVPEQIDALLHEVGDNLAIVQAPFSMDIEKIMLKCDEFIAKHNGRSPVIIIDYLQIVAPSKTDKGAIVDPRMSMDHIVHSLKVYQMKTGATIICVSSLNRMNYAEHLSFESFKESGGIEYTADVIMGLELDIINQPEFEKMLEETVNANGSVTKKLKSTTLSDKRRLLDAAKAQPIRKLSLVTLKNRFGPVSTCALFNYVSAYDVFLPVPSANGSAGTPASVSPNPYT